MAIVVLIVWVGIGYGAILVLELFGVDGLRDADGAADGAGTYVYWLAAPTIVVGGAVLALLVMVVGAIISPRIRSWLTTSESTRPVPTDAAPTSLTTPPTQPTSTTPTWRGRAGDLDGGDDRDDVDPFDDAFDVDDEFDHRSGSVLGVEEFDVCPSCGNLIEVLRGRLECLNCGQRFD